MIQLFRFFYNLLWCLVAPFLVLCTRYKYGWRQRFTLNIPNGPYDLWIQSASGGESYLSLELIREILRQGKGNIRILLSAGTPQGVSVLEAGIKGMESLDIDIVYFPIDAPAIMSRAFKQYKPQQVIIVETELWPSFLICAKKLGVPVHLVNGRMSIKSHKSYAKLQHFFSHYGPRRVYAISPADVDRFQDVCRSSVVQLMNNIKFDRLKIENMNDGVGAWQDRTGVRDFFVENTKVIVLGSIRREEEELICELVEKILLKKRDVSIALFPKHECRAEGICKKMQSLGIDAQLRTTFMGDARVVVWDTFGELSRAYRSADAVFVGGSLLQLGGQNFLEPLVAGVRPIIGPYYHNFLWVGDELFDMDLVQKIHNIDELHVELLRAVNNPVDAVFKVKVKKYLQQKQGGTSLVVTEILKALKTDC